MARSDLSQMYESQEIDNDNYLPLIRNQFESARPEGHNFNPRKRMRDPKATFHLPSLF